MTSGCSMHQAAQEGTRSQSLSHQGVGETQHPTQLGYHRLRNLGIIGRHCRHTQKEVGHGFRIDR
jgi:hypothetical protein